jgi:two-component system response regulator DesR
LVNDGTIGVRVVADEALTRSAIEMCIRAAPGLSPVPGRDPLAPHSATGPRHRSVLIIDADDYPDVADAARRLREGHDAVVVLGRRLPAVLVRQIVQSGIDAVVSKRASIDELLAVVRRTAAGEDHVDPRVAATVLRAEACPLTARERDVLRLVDRSLSTRQCAAELHLAEGTVRNLISSAVRKVGAPDRGRAASDARDLGWI